MNPTHAIPLGMDAEIRGIDPLALARRIEELERERERAVADWQAAAAERDELRRLRGESEPLIRLANRRLDELKSETVSRLRAIALHTGEENRPAAMERWLSGPSRTVDDIVRAWNAAGGEMAALYPDAPLAIPATTSPAPAAFPDHRFEPPETV